MLRRTLARRADASTRLRSLLLGPVVLLALASCTATPAPAAVHHGLTAPPGRLVFHIDDKPGGEGGTGSLFTSTTDGRDEKQITHAGPNRDGAPDWSRDGKRIVFARSVHPGDTGADDIYTVNPDGSGLKRLTTGKNGGAGGVITYDSLPAFSPDGRSIAFVHDGFIGGVAQQHSDIGIMHADGTHRRLITHFPANGNPVGELAWSPDGRRLAYAYADQMNDRFAIFIIGTDGKGRHRITSWRQPAQEHAGVDWTPHGDLIVFRYVTDSDAGIGNFFTVHPDGSGLRQLTHLRNRTISHGVAFSPDGRWLTFGASDQANGPNDLYLVRVDGSDLHRVKKTPSAEGAPDWGPAG